MANITVTAAQVGLVDPLRDQKGVASVKLGSTVTKGQEIAISTAGLAAPADASSGGGYLIQGRGIALSGGGGGQVIDYVFDGQVTGFDLSGNNIGDLIYISNTAGALATTTDGDVNVPVGIVDCLTDNALTKVLRLVPSWLTVYA